MGCWNGTCAITNVPVTYGDNVVVLLLVSQGNSPDNLCYPTSFWQPYSLYFEGTYDDYGGVEGCHGPMLEFIVEDVKNHLIEMEVGENQYHDIAVKKDKFDIKLLFEADNESRLFIPSKWKNQISNCDKQHIKHITILKDVFHCLISQYFVKRYVPDPDGDYMKATYHDQYIGEVEKMAIEYVDALILKHADARYCDFADTYLRLSEGHFPDMTRPIDIINNFVNDGKNELAYAAAAQIAHIGWIGSYMYSARRMWCPQSGSGSQNTETIAQRLTAKLTIEAANDLQAAYDNS